MATDCKVSVTKSGASPGKAEVRFSSDVRHASFLFWSCYPFLLPVSSSQRFLGKTDIFAEHIVVNEMKPIGLRQKNSRNGTIVQKIAWSELVEIKGTRRKVGTLFLITFPLFPCRWLLSKQFQKNSNYHVGNEENLKFWSQQMPHSFQIFQRFFLHQAVRSCTHISLQGNKRFMSERCLFYVLFYLNTLRAWPTTFAQTCSF